MQHDLPSHSLSSLSQWELAFVYAFISVFGNLKDKDIYAFPQLQPQELEDALSLHQSQLMDDLLCSFLNNALNRKKPLDIKQCPKELTKMVNARIQAGDIGWKTNLMNTASFGELSPTNKLTILRTLVEWQLQECQAIRSAIEAGPADSKEKIIMSKPIGKDSEKRLYWHFGDSAWLWREKSKLRKGCQWERVCCDLDGMQNFAASLSQDKQPERSLAQHIEDVIVPLVQNAIRRRERQETARQRQAMAEALVTERRLRPRRSSRPSRYTFGDDPFDEYAESDNDDIYEAESSPEPQPSPPPSAPPVRSSARLNLRSSSSMYID